MSSQPIQTSANKKTIKVILVGAALQCCGITIQALGWTVFRGDRMWHENLLHVARVDARHGLRGIYRARDIRSGNSATRLNYEQSTTA